MQSFVSRVQTILVAIAVLAVVVVSLSPLLVSAQPVLKGPLQPNTDVQELPKYNQGVDESIKAYLCAPSENAAEQGTALYDCIGRLYRFGITAGAIVLVFIVVLAGYLYITGGESAKGKAKGMILSAITGMGILLGSFALLNFINPSLVEIRTIQPPIFESADLPSCEVIGFGARCITAGGQVFNPGGGTVGERGQCTAQNLGLCTKWNVNEAIAVCNIESRGYNKAQSGTDLCDNLTGPDGKYLSFSYGIMQVSLKSMGATFPECSGILNYPEGAQLRLPGNCPGGFATAQNGTPYCKRRRCEAPKGIEAIHRCVNILYDVAKNVQASCTLYGQSCWRPWPDTGKVVPDYKRCPR